MRSFTSNAILPQLPVTSPRKHPTSAMRSRTVCQEISGWPSLSSFISSSCTFRPSLPSDDSVPAAPPNSPTNTRGFISLRRCLCRSNAASIVAILYPKVIGTACCRLLRPAIGVSRYFFAGEAIANSVYVPLDDRERLANLHNCGGIGDVLGGGAPVRPFPEPILAELHE